MENAAHPLHWMEWNPLTGRLLLWLYVQPGAPRTTLAGFHQGRLKIKVAAPPAEGQANSALVSWLAKQFDIPKQRVELAQGDTTRYKKIIIHAPRTFPPDWPWVETPGTKHAK